VDDARLTRIDETLGRLGDAVKVMTANLVDLEATAARQTLDTTTFTGATAIRAEQALATLSWLWSQFIRIKEVVEEAEKLRGSRRRLDGPHLDELEHLVLGPSVAVPPLVVPLADRGLLTPGETPAATSATELLADMATAFEAVRSDILAIGGAWADGISRLEVMTSALRALTAAATGLDAGDDPDLAAGDALVRRAALVFGTDPLSQTAALDEAEGALALAEERVAELSGWRAALPARLDAARRSLDEVAALVARGGSAAAEAREKIVDPAGLLPPLGPEPLDDAERGLRPWLQRLTAVADQGSWREANLGLVEWEAVASATHDAAEVVANANSRPLQVRAELRGRLDALSARAARLGLAEDPVLGAVRVQAREVLFSAPCDLERAAALVATFGTTLFRAHAAPRGRYEREEGRT
jgi:hypothetical protein